MQADTPSALERSRTQNQRHSRDLREGPVPRACCAYSVCSELPHLEPDESYDADAKRVQIASSWPSESSGGSGRHRTVLRGGSSAGGWVAAGERFAAGQPATGPRPTRAAAVGVSGGVTRSAAAAGLAGVAPAADRANADGAAGQPFTLTLTYDTGSQHVGPGQ
jgi:hypothetical protein